MEVTSLDALLAASDFVSMHVPDTPETMGMLDEARIAAMKPGAYLVNVTNSSVADRAALAAALTEGRLAGAALDVHEAHPIPPDSLFLGLPNVLLTPHIGGATRETIERHSAMVAEDFERFARGEQPLPARQPGRVGAEEGLALQCVEAGAVVPEHLAAGLVREVELEELVHGVGEGAVRVRGSRWR